MNRTPNQLHASVYIKEMPKEDNLVCPNCSRRIPSKKHLRKHGCKWCVPEKLTKYGNGKYS